jgi:excinuclease ABC subunit B
MLPHAVFVSATPDDYEKEISGKIVEQVIRPTGLVDPAVEVRPAVNQVDDLIGEINKRAEKNERVLVTTLTKKMSEDLASYFSEIGIKAKYLHSGIETIERVELITDLRKGEFDCLIGINLLREGLDIPEVSLVAIMDADKEGFLRSARSLIQTSGRAARNINGMVIMYADTVTRSMKEAIDETGRRRKIQEKYNKDNKITPRSIQKDIFDIIEREYASEDSHAAYIEEYREEYRAKDAASLRKLCARLRDDMLKAAGDLEFEKAAVLRDQMVDIEKKIKLLEKTKKK